MSCPRIPLVLFGSARKTSEEIVKSVVEGNWRLGLHRGVASSKRDSGWSDAASVVRCVCASKNEACNGAPAHAEKNLVTAPLFDIGRYTGNLESAFIAMRDNWRAGEAPKAIIVREP